MFRGVQTMREGRRFRRKALPDKDDIALFEDSLSALGDEDKTRHLEPRSVVLPSRGRPDRWRGGGLRGSEGGTGRRPPTRRRATRVPKRGLEPPRPYGHYALNVARLPVPPLGQCGTTMIRKLGAVAQALRWPSTVFTVFTPCPPAPEQRADVGDTRGAVPLLLQRPPSPDMPRTPVRAALFALLATLAAPPPPALAQDAPPPPDAVSGDGAALVRAGRRAGDADDDGQARPRLLDQHRRLRHPSDPLARLQDAARAGDRPLPESLAGYPRPGPRPPPAEPAPGGHHPEPPAAGHRRRGGRPCERGRPAAPGKRRAGGLRHKRDGDGDPPARARPARRRGGAGLRVELRGARGRRAAHGAGRRGLLPRLLVSANRRLRRRGWLGGRPRTWATASSTWATAPTTWRSRCRKAGWSRRRARSGTRPRSSPTSCESASPKPPRRAR